ncbi:hypothetical protein ABBQ38_012375 [Trebouxia sp. C0009 RCD-2024]
MTYCRALALCLSARTICSLCVAVLFVADTFFTGVLVPRVWPAPHRHMRLMRHLTSADWDNAAIEKSNLPRYMLSQKSFEEVPVWILSLQRSPERRASILVQLTAANISFEFVDAVDGQGLLPAEEVEEYIKGSRLQLYHSADPYMRAKAGCDLSHLRLLHRLVAEGQDAAIIIEDDAILLQEEAVPFKKRLRRLFNQLPNDWELLMLNSCFSFPSKLVGAGVRQFRGGVCTLGYVATRGFALKVLQAARTGTRNIDNLFDMMAQFGEVNAYLAQPAVVLWSNFSSTMG